MFGKPRSLRDARSLSNRQKRPREAAITATVTIDEPGYIVHVVISDPWLSEDIPSLRPLALSILNEARHRMHMLMEFHTMKIPLGVLRSHDSPVFRHPNSGYIVLVGVNRSGAALANLLFQLARFDRVYMCSTLDEGRRFLRKYVEKDLERTQIHPLSPPKKDYNSLNQDR